MFSNNKLEVFVLHPTSGHNSYDVYRIKYQESIRKYLETNNCRNLVKITQTNRRGSKPDVHQEHRVCWREGDIIIKVPEGIDIYWGIRDFLESLSEEKVNGNEPVGFKWSSPIEIDTEEEGEII